MLTKFRNAIWRWLPIVGFSGIVALIQVHAQTNGPANPLAPTKDQAAQDRAIDQDHFRKIYGAIQAYRKDHANDVPNWLSDLFPQYLRDTNLLLSPVEVRTGRSELFGAEDPKIHTSYIYEFNPNRASDWVNQGRAVPLTNKEWKKKQMETFGEAVPLLRCMLPTPALNLSFSGEVYETALFWENHTNTLALMNRLKRPTQPLAAAAKTLLLTVLDAESDQPLAEADVKTDVRNELGYQPSQILLADTNGQSQIGLPGNRIEEVTITVKKPAYIPVQIIWQGAEDIRQLPADYRLKLFKGVTLGGMVCDKHAKPIVGASVRLHQLPQADDAVGRERRVRDNEPWVLSDSTGHWEYYGAAVSPDRFWLELSHPEFRRTMFAPAETRFNGPAWELVSLEELRSTNAILVLRRNLIIKGTAVDAATKEPISQFKLYTRYAGNRPSAPMNRYYAGRDGQFEIGFTEASGVGGPAYFRVEAEGYVPERTPRIPAEAEGTLTFNITLRRGDPIVGTILDPEGRPLDDVEVMLATESQGAVLSQAALARNSGTLVTRTSDRGRFSFLPEPEAQRVFAVHAQGFAEASLKQLAAAPAIKLKPWSKIEGTVRSGSLSGASLIALITAELHVPNLFQGAYHGPLALEFAGFAAETDPEGHFTIEHVPPGQRYIWHAVPAVDPPPSMDLAYFCFNGRAVTLKPGETANLDLGKTGQLIKGKLALASSNDAPAWTALFGLMRLNAATTNSSLGQQREYALTFNPEGSFVVDEVPAGSFDLNLLVFRPPQLIGRLRQSITIPEKTTNGAAQPFDLGQLEINPIPVPKPGDPAPPFSLRTLDGTPLQLSDCRGKYVLLSFWATWCDPRSSFLPGLKSAYETWGNNNQLLCISLNLDADMETARSFVQQNELKWLHGHLGPWSGTSLPSEYGVATLPAAFLISPEGKLLEANLDFDDLSDTLKKHLKTP